jgi:hypothetical protein
MRELCRCRAIRDVSVAATTVITGVSGDGDAVLVLVVKAGMDDRHDR